MCLFLFSINKYNTMMKRNALVCILCCHYLPNVLSCLWKTEKTSSDHSAKTLSMSRFTIKMTFCRWTVIEMRLIIAPTINTKSRDDDLCYIKTNKSNIAHKQLSQKHGGKLWWKQSEVNHNVKNRNRPFTKAKFLVRICIDNKYCMNNNLIVKLSKCFHSIVSVHEWNNIACRRQSEEVRRVSYGVLMSLRSILLYLREKKPWMQSPD